MIISGFPGIGKSYLCAKFPETIVDSDSSAFTKEEDWQKKYVTHICDRLVWDHYLDYVLCSSHEEVRAELYKEKIPFILVYPDKTQKEEYIQRYKNRGSSEAFMKLLSDNFDSWISSCEKQEGCLHVVLHPGKFLSDIVK